MAGLLIEYSPNTVPSVGDYRDFFMGSNIVAPPNILLEWDFGDGTTAANNGGGVSKAYAAPGVYTVSLTLTDLDSPSYVLHSSTELSIGMPTYAIQYTAAAAMPALNESVSYSLDELYIPKSVQYTWSFGDGSTFTEAQPTKTYATAGTYLISLDRYDSALGLHLTFTRSVTVGSPSAGASLAQRRIATVHKHEQPSASTTWNITHNLMSYPIVDVFVNVNGALNKIIPMEILYVDKNTCTVNFSVPYSGYATVV